MHSYLMCPACFKYKFTVTKACESFNHFIMCCGISRIQTVDCLFFSVVGTSANGSVDCAFVISEIPHHNSFIFSSETVLLNLLCKGDVRFVVFCNDKKSACVLVNSVDNARSYDTVDARKTFSAVIHQRIYESACVITRCGMDNHILGLIDNKQVIIFINDIKRNILCNDIKLFRLRHFGCDNIACFELYAF